MQLHNRPPDRRKAPVVIFRGSSKKCGSGRTSQNKYTPPAGLNQQQRGAGFRHISEILPSVISGAAASTHIAVARMRALMALEDALRYVGKSFAKQALMGMYHNGTLDGVELQCLMDNLELAGA